LFALVLAVLVALFNVDKFRAVIPVDSTMDNFVDNILFPVGRIASWIVISIILFCLIACIKNISDQKNLLYINEKGFEENISKQSVGFVEWCDVESLAVKQFFNSKMYGIKLKTPEKYNITKSSDDGHILFSSQYFIGQSDEVEAIFKYHMDKCKADSCTHTE
jgi:hypothetical protein